MAEVAGFIYIVGPLPLGLSQGDYNSASRKRMKMKIPRMRNDTGD